MLTQRRSAPSRNSDLGAVQANVWLPCKQPIGTLRLTMGVCASSGSPRAMAQKLGENFIFFLSVYLTFWKDGATRFAPFFLRTITPRDSSLLGETLKYSLINNPLFLCAIGLPDPFFSGSGCRCTPPRKAETKFLDAFL